MPAAEKQAPSATAVASGRAPAPGVPETFERVRLSGPAGAPGGEGALCITQAEVLWTADGASSAAWSVPLAEVNLHALCAEAPAHVYMQTGDAFAEARLFVSRGADGADVLLSIYNALSRGVERTGDCAEEDEEDALTGEPLLAGARADSGAAAAAGVMERLDGMLQVDEGVVVPGESAGADADAGDGERVDGNGVGGCGDGQ